MTDEDLVTTDCHTAHRAMEREETVPEVTPVLANGSAPQTRRAYGTLA